MIYELDISEDAVCSICISEVGVLIYVVLGVVINMCYHGKEY